VRGLLAGGPADVGGLGYELDAWHLGMIGTGLGVGQAVRAAVAGSACELLCVPHDEQSVWAWLGGQRKAVTGATKRLRSARWPAGVTLAVGELREGVDGWRWTHHEARAALMVAPPKPQGVTRCADVILEAAMLRDGTLARTLRDVYLSPLDELRIGGQVARDTLRAYFAAGRSTRDAADRLKVDRRTVWYRLDKIAKGLGWSPEERGAELEIALRVEALEEAVRGNDRADRRS
jgi:sugar diacid utilization regulator